MSSISIIIRADTIGYLLRLWSPFLLCRQIPDFVLISTFFMVAMCPEKDNSCVGKADYDFPFFLSALDLCMIYNPVLADKIRGGVTPGNDFTCSSVGTCKVCTSCLEL